MKPFSKKTFWLITELMVSRNVPVVQEPHGQTELNQLLDSSNDNGKSCRRTWKMIGLRGVTVREAVKRTVWARNTQLTVSGCSPLGIATGRRPPHLLDIETSDPAQLSVDPLPEDRTQQELQRLALKGHRKQDNLLTSGMTWLGELSHQMDLTNQVTRSLCGRPLSVLTLLLRRHGRRKDGSEVLLSHKEVLWSMFMLTVQLCVSINPRSGVITMNGMMLLFRDLTVQILSHLQLKMKMATSQI